MTAQIIPFPNCPPFSTYVEECREGGGWILLCRGSGWQFNDRDEANAEAVALAAGFGVPAKTAAPP